MITTAARLDVEASKGNASSACGALRNTADDSKEESPRSYSIPTSQIERLAKDAATAEKRRGMAFHILRPPKKQRIQVIVRIRPIEDKAGRYIDHGIDKKKR